MATSLTVKPVVSHDAEQYLIYDESVSGLILPQWFDAEYWQKQNKLQATSAGRGSAWFIDGPQHQYVLRHYCRGGLIAKLSYDKYIWHGLDRTRAWREWNLLAHLQRLALPAPVPVAARVMRCGLFYRADIMTHRIDNSRTLSSQLTQQALTQQHWQTIGSTIKRFHTQSIYHADLNAHNILLGADAQVYVIDFDKGAIRTSAGWQADNLKRLRRSLDKLAVIQKDFHFSEQDWQQLLLGYQS